MKRQINIQLWNVIAKSTIDLVKQPHAERDLFASFAKTLYDTAKEQPVPEAVVVVASGLLEQMAVNNYPLNPAGAPGIMMFQFGNSDMRDLIERLGGYVHVKDVD